METKKFVSEAILNTLRALKRSTVYYTVFPVHSPHFVRPNDVWNWYKNLSQEDKKKFEDDSLFIVYTSSVHLEDCVSDDTFGSYSAKAGELGEMEESLYYDFKCGQWFSKD